MTGGREPARRHQEPEAIGQPRVDLGQRQDLRPGCGQLHRQRQPVERGADSAGDQEARVIAAGRDIFELSGYREQDLMGRDVIEALGLSGFDGENPAKVALEWGVRRLGQKLELRSRAGNVKPVTGDFFPAYDEDGGLLVGLTPR